MILLWSPISFHTLDNFSYLSRFPRDRSKHIFYTCDEKGHFSRDCTKNKSSSHKKKGSKRRHHSHAAEDDEPSSKITRYESEDSSSEEEYVLIFALMRNITHGSNDWIIDSGASKHMTRFKESFVKLLEHESPHKVKLGDDYQYPIKGSGESSYKLESGNYMTMKEVLMTERVPVEQHSFWEIVWYNG